MALINTARALDDARFLWRVRAAMLNTAAYQVRAGATGPARAYAEHVLANPMTEDHRMEALVATQPDVSDAVEVDQYNTVTTEGVTDAMIEAGVAANWDIAARLTFPAVENE